MITWSCHMIYLSKFLCYLYLDPIIQFKIVDQVFKCIGNYFLFGALITHRWCLLFSFWRCRVMGMRPAMASTSSDGEVQKASVIQKATLHCIFFNSVMFLTIEVPLKNHSWNPYKAMGRTQVLYRSHFWIERRLLEEFPSIFMVLKVERHFMA